MSPHLVLRPCTIADVDALHALWTEASVRRWLWDDAVLERLGMHFEGERQVENRPKLHYAIARAAFEGALRS